MNKIKLAFFVSLILCYASYGQVVVLEVKNPFPRIGDKFEIGYTIFKDTSKNSYSSDFKKYLKETEENKLGHGTLIFTNLISDIGTQTFGPFILSVNNKKITTKTITINVDSPLPIGTPGIWIRQSTFEGQEYLIFEQRILKPDDYEIADSDFAELDEKAIPERSIFFESDYYETNSNKIEIDGKPQTEGYKLTLYHINKTEAFKTPFLLDKTNLKNLPKSDQEYKFLIR